MGLADFLASLIFVAAFCAVIVYAVIGICTVHFTPEAKDE